MSWADAVKQLKETASNLKVTNQQNIINQTQVHMTVNQQINQQFQMHQENQQDENIYENTNPYANPNGTSNGDEGINSQSSSSAMKSSQVGSQTNTYAPLQTSLSTQGKSTNISSLTKSGGTFEDEMKALNVIILQEREKTESKLNNLGTVMKNIVVTNNERFKLTEQQQIYTQIHTQACMIGIQEMASKLNITISSSDSLIEQASHQHKQLPSSTKATSSTLITSTEKNNIIRDIQETMEDKSQGDPSLKDSKIGDDDNNRNASDPEMTVSKYSTVSKDTAIISMSPGPTRDNHIHKSKLTKLEDHLSSITVSTADLSDTDMHVLTQDSFRSGIDASDQPGIVGRCDGNTIPGNGNSGF